MGHNGAREASLMKRAAFWCAAGLAVLLGTAAALVALAVYRPQLLRPMVQRALAPRGGSATLADLRLTLSPPTLTLSGLAIAGPPKEGELLRLDYARVEWIPGRFSREGPWLRHVEARGLVFERSRPKETTGPPDLTPITRIFDVEDLSLTDARIRMALPQGILEADGLRVRLAPGEGGIRSFIGEGEISFRRNGSTLARGKITSRGKVTPGPAIDADLELAAARLELPWLSGDVTGRSTFHVTRKNFEARELSLSLPNALLRPVSDAVRPLEPIRLSAAGSASLDGKEPALELRGLDVGGLLRARGSFRGPALDELSGAAEGEVPRIERVKALLGSALPARLAGMEMTGRLPFRIVLSVREKKRMLELELLPREVLLSLPDAGLRCRFGGTLKAGSPLQEWLRGRASGDWKLSARAGDVLYQGRALPLGKLDARGAGRAADGSLRIEGVDIRSETLGRVTGDLSIRDGSPGGQMKGDGLPAAALLSLAEALTGRKWSGWSPAGTIDVAARLEPAGGGPRVTSTIGFDRVGFSSPGGDVMGSALAGRIGLEARLESRPRLTADVNVDRGEALWGTVYLNLAQNALDLHAAGTRTAPGEYKDLALDGGLAQFGRLNLKGTIRRSGGSWRHQGQAVLNETRLGPLFRTLLTEPLATSHPDLAALRMDGTAGVELSFSGSEKTADLKGRLRLRSVDVRREGQPPLLSGLELDLPIEYSLGEPDPGRPRPTQAAAWGRLRLKELRVAGQEPGPLDMPVALVPNRLYIEGAIDASLFGAKLNLRRIQVEEPLSPDFRVTLAAQLSGLDLARIYESKPLLEGHLEGALDPVHIGRERLTAVGDLTGELFGGKLDVRSVTVERPFSPGPEVGGDIDVALLDLERFSEALGIGRITGRLSGSLKGLRIAYGQPVAFHLKMESVPVDGVTQLVSLKAVNSISVVSTGSGLTGVGTSLLTTFFREFPYAKIGVESALKNDVFTVRGLIHEGGVEYLVKRRLFSGINVINRNPDNRIGFSDMLERAKRVTGERAQ